MNTKMKSLIAAIACMILVGCTKVKPGQVWVKNYGDPFNIFAKTNTVIAVKSRWVKYHDQNGLISSDPCWNFVRHSTLLTEAPELVESK